MPDNKQKHRERKNRMIKRVNQSTGRIRPVKTKAAILASLLLGAMALPVPLHENLGEDYCDNPREVGREYRHNQGVDWAEISVKPEERV